MTRWKLVSLALVAVFALAACGDGGSSEDTLVTLPDESTTTSVASDAAVDADNVLLAVALLEAGDVDAAIAAGVVNPDEVEAAAEAVSDGTLDVWVERADGR